MKTEIEFYGRAWRAEFSRFLSEVESEIIVVCPYIRDAEAEFVVQKLSKATRVCTLTSLRVDSIVQGALEINGIRRLADFSAGSEAINVPKLHAKVFVADTARAIVTSANLTTSGIDHNYEYGISVRGTELVAKILSDLEECKSIGTPISGLERIQKLADSVKKAQQKLDNQTARESAELKNAIKQLEQKCLSMQVEKKSKTAVFRDAVRYVLTSGPATTGQIHAAIQTLYPELCDDSIERVIDGKTFGKLWKHDVRNAQQIMKMRDEIKWDKDTGIWYLV